VEGRELGFEGEGESVVEGEGVEAKLGIEGEVEISDVPKCVELGREDCVLGIGEEVDGMEEDSITEGEGESDVWIWEEISKLGVKSIDDPREEGVEGEEDLRMGLLLGLWDGVVGSGKAVVWVQSLG
jgi:hypothetical protein